MFFLESHHHSTQSTIRKKKHLVKNQSFDQIFVLRGDKLEVMKWYLPDVPDKKLRSKVIGSVGYVTPIYAI